jgi:hypothetical protein
VAIDNLPRAIDADARVGMQADLRTAVRNLAKQFERQ